MKFCPAYIAGLIDGEGCIDTHCASKTPHYTPRLRICLSGSSGLSLLSSLSQYLDCGSINTRKLGGNRKNHHEFTVTRKSDLQRVLLTIRDHLVMKKEQADFALSWIERSLYESMSLDSQLECREHLKELKSEANR